MRKVQLWKSCHEELNVKFDTIEDFINLGDKYITLSNDKNNGQSDNLINNEDDVTNNKSEATNNKSNATINKSTNNENVNTFKN